MVKKIEPTKKLQLEASSNVRDIFENAVECISRIDRQGTYLSVNANYAEVYGYQLDEMMGMPWKDSIHQDDIETAEKAREEMLAMGRSEINIRGIRKNETVFYKHIVMVKGLDNGKSPVSHYCFIQDITDQTLDERKLFKEVEFNYRKFQTLVDLQPECCNQISKDGELIYMNAAGLAMIDADSLQQVKGLCVYELIAEEHREKFKLLNQRVFAGETAVLEFEIVGLKGTRRWMETHARPVKDSFGSVVEHLAVTRDITERKQTEIALQEREQQYSELINDIDAIVWEVELPDFLFTFVSEPAVKILGYPIDNWYQPNFWLEHLHPEDRDTAYNFCAIQTEQGIDHQFEYRMLAANGAIIWMRDIVHIVDSESGAPEKLRGVMFNITQQKETEAAFRTSQKRLSQAVETSPDIIVMTRFEDGKMIEVNKGFTISTGFTEEEALGKTSVELNIWPSKKNREEYVSLLKEHGSLSNVEFEFKRKNGELYPGAISTSLIEHNGEQCTLSITRDISGLKNTENLLSRTNRALMVLNRCNHSLVHITDEKKLLESVCDIVTNIGDYRMSWVGYPKHDAKKGVTPMAVSGFEEDYLNNAMSWADEPIGRGPTGTCIRTNKPYICRDIATDFNFTPWRQSALARDYASMIALPLSIDNQSLGALLIYSSKINAFDVEEVELLTHLSDNLSYGIQAIRVRHENEKTEKLIKLENEIFQLIHEGLPINELCCLVVNKIEQVLVETICSINLLDKEGKYLWSVAAPSLPIAYIEAIDGFEIGPTVGSCGSAAFFNKHIVVPDIENDPLWKDYVELARTYNLKACYSTPIRRTDGSVIGTISNYYHTVQESAADIFLMEHVAQILGGVFEREKIAEALRESEERFALAMEGASDGLWDWKIESNNIYYSPKWRSMLGLGVDNEHSGIETFTALLHPDDIEKTFKGVEDYISGRTSNYSLEFRMRHKDGHYVDILSRGFGVKNNAGVVVRLVGTHVDISERKHAEQALKNSEIQFRTLYDDTPAMFFNANADGEILTVNEYGANQLGYDVEELIGNNVNTIIHKNDRKNAREKIKQCFEMPEVVHRWELRKLHKDGHIIMVRETVRVVTDVQGEPTLFIVCEDISEAFRLSEELSYQATHDALTGLINRAEFERRLRRVLDANQSMSEEHAICYLDLDQFKIINDTCGHLAGDELLRQLSELLLNKVRKRDTLARLGGDEFGVLMEHCGITHARRVSNSLRKIVEEFRFVWKDKKFSIGVSIGLVPISVDIGNVNDVLSAADAACYAAKDAGRNRVHVYSADDKQLSQRRGEMKWVGRINHALEEDLFVLYYQKIVLVKASEEKGEHYELLLRMKAKDGSIIPPGAFLSAAERFGLSTKIDHWVVNAAFSWLATHPAKQKKLELCTINLSGQTLGNDKFMKFLLNKLDENLVPADKICFEITETSAIANLANAIRFIKKIKEKGCRFALDDFGSGVSSFGYLKNLPVDYLKIDGAFVRDIVTDKIDRAMVKSINEIGQIMGKKTIAEFVENDAILKELEKIGVDYAQGYGIAKPRALINTKK
jgi:diguanylate cyclase (GGDEF)-like protein/PAS domain S-box-containing protein